MCRAVGPLVVIPVTREALLITVAKVVESNTILCEPFASISPKQFPSEKGKLMSTVAQYREHNTT